MRCLLRNAGAMLAMLWSGAAAAVAGPVSIRTSDPVTAEPDPAAIVQLDRDVSDESIAWFGENLALQPIIAVAKDARGPAAIMIPLPGPIWLAVGGLSAVLIVARVFNPRGASETITA